MLEYLFRGIKRSISWTKVKEKANIIEMIIYIEYQ